MQNYYIYVSILLIVMSSIFEIKSQTCNKGGVYEVNLKYLNKLNGKITEYRKYFLLYENLDNTNKVTLFELLPVRFNTPNYLKGGSTIEENEHFIWGHKCEHFWNGNEVILPESFHIDQIDNYSNNENYYWFSFTNSLRRSQGDLYFEKVCPLVLYFYGKDYNQNNRINIRKSNNGLMPLSENTTITVNNLTITSSVKKISWSDDYLSSLVNLSNLINVRWNYLFKRYENIIAIDKYASNNLDLDYRGKDKDLLKIIAELTNNCSNANHYGEDNNHYYQQIRHDMFTNNIYGDISYLDYNDKCFGINQIINNFNTTNTYGNTYNYGKPVVMDLIAGSYESNKKNKLILDSLATVQYDRQILIKPLRKSVETYKRIVSLFSKFKDQLVYFDNQLQPANYRTIVIQDYDTIQDRSIYLHDSASSVFTFGYKNAPWDISLKNNYSQTNLLSNYNYYRIGTHSYDSNLRKLNFFTKEIKELNQSIRDSLISIKKETLGLLSNEQIVNDLIRSTELDQSSFPKYLKKLFFNIIYFDTCRSDCNNIVSMNNTLKDYISYLNNNKVFHKGYRLVDSKNYVEDKKNLLPGFLKYFSTNNKKKGSKIVANLFVLNSNIFNIEYDRYLDVLDDAEIYERLEELFNLDEDDIEDNFEDIINRKMFTIDAFNSEKGFGYILDLNDMIISIDRLLSNCTTEAERENSKLELINRDYVNTKYICDKFTEIYNYDQKYKVSKNVSYSNIPYSNYTDICSFLKDYNYSRGTLEKLFEIGDLRNTFVNSYLNVFGNFNNFKHYSWNDLLTFNPKYKQWNIITYSSSVGDSFCSGFGRAMAIGFDCNTDNINVGSVFIGILPIGNW